MCNLIASIFDTNEEHIKVNSCAKFAMNLMNIQEVMSCVMSCVFTLKKNQTSITATT